MSVTSASAAEAAKPATSTLNPSAVTEPVAKAGRKVYDQAAGGVQWYLEKWQDMVHEARSARAPAPGSLNVDDVLAGLPGAKVASNIPGRARLRLKSLKRQDQIAEQTAQALANMPGISQAEVNPLTGSVLIFYDAKRYTSLDELLEAVKPSQT